MNDSADASAHRLHSPDGRLALTLTLDRDGRAHYAVQRDGQPVLRPSKLGFLFTDAPKFERGLHCSPLGSGTHDEVWEQPWGEARFVRDHHNELRLRLHETDAPRRALDLVIRAFDDGVAIGSAVQATFPLLIARFFSLAPTFHFDFLGAGEAMIIGLLTATLFTWPALLGVEQILKETPTSRSNCHEPSVRNHSPRPRQTRAGPFGSRRR